MPLVTQDPTFPDIHTAVQDYSSGSAASFATQLQTNQDTLETRDREMQYREEKFLSQIGKGTITGGTISAGTGLSVNITALSAMVPDYVELSGTTVVGGLTASSTNYLFLRQDGTFTTNTTGSAPTDITTHGDYLQWGTATTDSSSVTAVDNTRTTWAMLAIIAGGGGGGGGITWKGAWSAVTAYVANDAVSDNGSSYICISGNTNQEPPNATYWDVLASEGSAGATGATGAQGIQGPAGAQGLTWRGAYSGGTTYAAYDVVSYNGSAYIALGATTGNLPTNATYWDLLASKGDTGATGAAGSNGSNGADGATILNGSGAPSSGAGNNGDYYIDTATGDVYFKSSGSWAVIMNISGGQGTQGLAGANAGIKYKYSTNTASSDPGSGFLKFDSATLSSITSLRISETDGDGNAISGLLAALDNSTSTTTKATFLIVKDGQPTSFLAFQITSTLTDNGAWDSYPITYVASGGTFSNNDTVRLFFALTGDAGSGDMTKAQYDTNNDGLIDLAAGGTGSGTASGARTNLGLGTMATQNASAVAITGGTITGMPDPSAATDVVNREYLEASIAAILPNVQAQGSNLVSGGQVVWQSAYSFLVSAAVYYINGVRYTSAQQTVTLTSADPTNDRIDVIYLDTSGTAGKVTGTAASQPSEPDVDPTSELKLTFVYVAAASSAPSTISNENIYTEGSEWTGSTSGTGWTLNSTNNPRTGTKDIEGTSVANGAYVQLQRSSSTVLTGFNQLVLYIRSKATWTGQRQLRLQFYLNGVGYGYPVSIASGSWGFDSSNTTTYQQIAIPVAQFGVPATQAVNQLRITDSGGSIGLYIDDVYLQTTGTNVTPPTTTVGITQTEADARYLQIANSLSDVGSASSARSNISAAPNSAHYLTTQAESELSAESSLGALSTGLLKISVSASVATPSTATEGTDYYKPGGTDVAVADGGTGSSTASGARSNLSAAASGSNSDITALLGITGQVEFAKGASVASANNLALGSDGNVFHITGTTQINLLSSSGWQAGSVVLLIFDGALTVKHNQTASGANKAILLRGASDYVTAANSMLVLVYDGTSWYDIRSGLTAANMGALVASNNLSDVSSAATSRANLGVAVFYDAGNSSTSLTLDFTNGHTQKVTLTGNCTFTFSNPVAGDVYVLHLVQDGTGSRTVTWPASVKWAGGTAPTLTTTASKRDIITFSFDGTSYYGVTSGLNY